MKKIKVNRGMATLDELVAGGGWSWQRRGHDRTGRWVLRGLHGLLWAALVVMYVAERNVDAALWVSAVGCLLIALECNDRAVRRVMSDLRCEREAAVHAHAVERQQVRRLREEVWSLLRADDERRKALAADEETRAEAQEEVQG